MPDKAGVVVVVVDMVDSYSKVVAESLPQSMIAVNPFLVRKRMLEIGSDILAKSDFEAFKKTDPNFVFHKSSARTVRRPSSIVDVNPYLKHEFVVRSAFHRVWRTHDPAVAARALDRFLSDIPKVLRRSYPDVVKAVERWHQHLAGSVVVPGLSRYTTGRSMLDTMMSSASQDGNDDHETYWQRPFDSES